MNLRVAAAAYVVVLSTLAAGTVPGASAASGRHCGKVTVPEGESATATLRVVRHRLGHPDESLSCRKARSIVRHYGYGFPGWICSHPDNTFDVRCSSGNRVGWLIQATQIR